MKEAGAKIAWNETQGATIGTQEVTWNFTWWVKAVRHAKRSHDWDKFECKEMEAKERSTRVKKDG